MKRLLTILLATALTMSMVACGTKKEEEVKEKQKIQKEEKLDEDKITITEDDIEEPIAQEENDEVVDTPQKQEVVETPKKEEVVETPKKEEVVEAPTQKKESEEKAPQKEPENNTPQVEKPNDYFNDTNNTYDINAVSVKPRHVYWKDGFLYAECFVINGFAHNVYNINVKTLSIANDSGMIASANFGALDGVVLAPYTHTLWTFRFTADCISAPNADLSRLIVNASTSNNY